MRIVDTHCHLEQADFAQDLEDVLQRADDVGVAMITSAIHVQDYDRTLALAREHDSVYAALGLDPIEFRHHESARTGIRMNADKLVAVGEAGLDHYMVRDHNERDLQEHAFRSLIALAIELKLPIQVHSRSAGAKALEVLRSENTESVHMHAFDGKAALAAAASRDLGYYFSIPTSVAHSSQKMKLAKAVHIDRLLLETDSPVLGADRDSRNEPANVWIALREVSRLLGREEEELRQIVLENTLRLYPTVGLRRSNREENPEHNS